MNYYPGQGLTIGTAVLGSTVGQTYPTGTTFTLCKLFGTLLTPIGGAVGTAGQEPSSGPGGFVLVPTWKGVTISASVTVADAVSGKIISVDKISTTSNEYGYFELYVIQGLTVNVSCPSFGKTVQVDTTGLTEKDLSSYF